MVRRAQAGMGGLSSDCRVAAGGRVKGGGCCHDGSGRAWQGMAWRVLAGSLGCAQFVPKFVCSALGQAQAGTKLDRSHVWLFGARHGTSKA